MVSFWNLTVFYSLSFKSFIHISVWIMWIIQKQICRRPSKKKYRSKNSYTAQYRVFLFRHRIGSKIVYRCSSTFRQITRSNFGYFVY